MSNAYARDPYEKSLAEIVEIDEDEENKTEKLTTQSEEENGEVAEQKEN